MANRNPMDFNGKLIPVDIEIPASIVVRIEKHCWSCDSLSKRCSSFVIDRVGSTEKKRTNNGQKKTKRNSKASDVRRVA